MDITAIKIGLIGDYSPKVPAHVAIPKALALAANETESVVETAWLATETIAQNIRQLSSFDALWCVPASPYASMDGALSAIPFAREHRRPFLGTCGGFQHALIEYVRNVLGYREADHAESNPEAEMPLIAPLSCPSSKLMGRSSWKKGRGSGASTAKVKSWKSTTATSASTRATAPYSNPAR